MTKHDKPRPQEHHAHQPHRKVFDVVPPGKAPASATSRPVIMGHKPPVQDDQFVVAGSDAASDNVGNSNVSNADDDKTSGQRASNPFESHPLLNPKQKVEITPSHADLDVGAVAIRSDAVAATAGTGEALAEPSKPAAESTSVPSSTSTLKVTSPPTVSTPVAAKPASSATIPASTSPGVWEMPSSSEESRKPGGANEASDAMAKTLDENLAALRSPASTAAEGANNAETDAATPRSTTSASTDAGLNTTLQQLTAQETDSANSNDASSRAPSHPRSSKTIDELLAETGAPNLEIANQPPQKTIISHHQTQHAARNWLIAIVIVIILAAIVADLLLDGGFITTKLNIPHTHFF